MFTIRRRPGQTKAGCDAALKQLVASGVVQIFTTPPPSSNREKFAKATKLPADPVATAPKPHATRPAPQQLAPPPAPTVAPVDHANQADETAAAADSSDRRSNREKFCSGIKLPGRQHVDQAETSAAPPIADQRSNREKFAAAIKLPK